MAKKPDPETVIYTYAARANTDATGQPLASLPGVPLRDLTAADFDAQPAHIQASITTSPLYRATATAASKAAAAPKVEAEEGQRHAV